MSFVSRVPQKLILFANAEEISTPITRTLEVIDDMAELQFSGKRYRYLTDRGIVLHHITPDECGFITEKSKQGIYKAMAGTAWSAKAFEGIFSNNDFSCVKHQPVRGFAPVCRFIYQKKTFNILKRNNEYYVTMIPVKGNVPVFDLEKEKDQKKFYHSYVFDINQKTTAGHCLYDRYSLYDLITRYKKIYNT